MEGHITTVHGSRKEERRGTRGDESELLYKLDGIFLMIKRMRYALMRRQDKHVQYTAYRAHKGRRGYVSSHDDN